MQVYISKLDKDVEVDFDALPETSKAYVIAYGLKQSLNDALAAKECVGEVAIERLNDRLAALKDGSVGIRSVGAPRDPLGLKAFQIASGLLRKKFSRKADPEAFDAKARELAKDERILSAARKALDAVSGLESEIEIAA